MTSMIHQRHSFPISRSPPAPSSSTIQSEQSNHARDAIKTRVYRPTDYPAVQKYLPAGLLQPLPRAYAKLDVWPFFTVTKKILIFIGVALILWSLTTLGDIVEHCQPPQLEYQALLVYYDAPILSLCSLYIVWLTVQFLFGLCPFALAALLRPLLEQSLRKNYLQYIDEAFGTGDLKCIEKHYCLSKAVPSFPPNTPRPEGEEEWVALGQSGFWVAELEGKVVGFVGLDNTSSACDRQSNTIELRRMSVAKEHQGKGISSLLLKRVIEHASAYRSNLNSEVDIRPESDFAEYISYPEPTSVTITLSTSEFQTEAIRLYEKKGFHEVKRVTLSRFIDMITFEMEIPVQSPNPKRKLK